METVPPAGRKTVMLLRLIEKPPLVLTLKVTFPENLQRLVIVLFTKPMVGALVPLEERVRFAGFALIVKSGVQPPVVVGVPVTMKERSWISMSSGSIWGEIGTKSVAEPPFEGRVTVVEPVAQVNSLPLASKHET